MTFYTPSLIWILFQDSGDAILIKMLDDEEFQDARSEEEEWMLARRGIQLVLNNQYNEAEKLFADRKDSIQLAAGHCFVVFMVIL